MGAIALFGEKYGDTVRVLKMGDFSTEFCGGTHVHSTGDIGVFKITQESAVASGIRRIEGITGEAVVNWIQAQTKLLKSPMMLKSLALILTSIMLAELTY